MISVAFGGKGAEVKDHKTLTHKLEEALNDDNLWILNVRIDPYAGRKQQEFAWLTRKDDNELPAPHKL